MIKASIVREFQDENGVVCWQVIFLALRVELFTFFSHWRARNGAKAMIAFGLVPCHQIAVYIKMKLEDSDCFWYVKGHTVRGSRIPVGECSEYPPCLLV